jgi:uncharacterized membrane protein YraQ (UPF0718 family)
VIANRQTNMLDIDTPTFEQQRQEAWRRAAFTGALVIGLAFLLRGSNPEQFAWATNFLLVFAALLIEAMPFVLLGAVAAAIIEIFVPISAFERLARIPRSLQVPAAGIAGFAFPVCDCGSVPVARRLASKGLAPAAAITFMLASPVLNPIVIASTFIAYRGRSSLWVMVLGRIGLGLLLAIVVGLVMGPTTKEQLLRPRPQDEEDEVHDDRSVPRRFFGHVADDFLFMAKFLIVGAAIAAAVQTFLPQGVLNAVAGAPILDIVAMMGLAFILSLCSESDAFFAASFVQFGSAAQLAFLVFGPMMDMKLASLYVGTYNRWFFRMAFIVVASVTLVSTLWLKVFVG